MANRQIKLQIKLLLKLKNKNNNNFLTQLSTKITHSSHQQEISIPLKEKKKKKHQSTYKIEFQIIWFKCK